MENLLISLPCGFDTTYGTLLNGEKNFRCMMCREEDLNVDDILNRAGNQLRIKQKEIEIEFEYLKKMDIKISSIKTDPHFYVDKCFEQILNELDLRRETLKTEFEQKLNDYYMETRDNLVVRKEKIIEELENSLEEKNLDLNSINLDFTTCYDLKDRIDLIECELEKILEKKREIKQILGESECVQEFKLSYQNDQIQMKNLFGEIRYGLFDYKHSIVLNNLEGVTCLERVDENTILSGSHGMIKLWDIQEEECTMEYESYETSILSVCLLDKDHFASCSNDDRIKIWEFDNGEVINTLHGHTSAILGLKLLSNGQLASCSLDKTIKLWSGSECVKTFVGHTGGVVCISEWRNNSLLSGSNDNTIKIWNIETCENFKSLTGHTDSVVCLQLINSYKLASGSSDSSIKIWNLKTGVCFNTLRGHTDCVNELALLKIGHLVSCSDDGMIRFWDIDLCGCLQTIEMDNNEPIRGLLLTKKEEIITGSFDQTIKILTRF